MLATPSASVVTPSATSQVLTLTVMRTTVTMDMAAGPTTSVPGTTVLTTTTSASSTTTTTPVVSPTMLTTPSTRRETEELVAPTPTSKSSRTPTDVTTVTNTRERELPPSPILDTVPATTSVSASVRPTAERVLASTARSRETTRMAPTVAPARTTASLALTTLATMLPLRLSLAPAEDSVLRTNLLAAPTRDGPDTALMSTRADQVTPRRDSVTVSATSAPTNSLPSYSRYW